MPRRMVSARSNRSRPKLRQSESNMSKRFQRKSSIRSKKSIMTPTSRRNKRQTVVKRKKTVKEIDGQLTMNKYKSTKPSRQEFQNESFEAPRQKSDKYL
mmetsp:Transcript_21731/g.19253  ORF Transcript_21731/g.19253 Transcript_21731/m.19253 type:complete len:99 (+) Transcript_21731:420-716(+)